VTFDDYLLLPLEIKGRDEECHVIIKINVK